MLQRTYVGFDVHATYEVALSFEVMQVYENGVQKHVLSCFRAAGEKGGLPGRKKASAENNWHKASEESESFVATWTCITNIPRSTVPVLLIICRDCEVQKVRYGEEVKDAPAGFPWQHTEALEVQLISITLHSPDIADGFDIFESGQRCSTGSAAHQDSAPSKLV